MSFFAQLGQSIALPMIDLWMSFIETLPGLVGGLLILFFGFLLGEVLHLLVIKGLKKINFDKFLHSLNISKTLEHFDVIYVIGLLLKWYVIVIFLQPAASMAGLGEFTVMLLAFAKWLPHFIIAIFVMIVAWVAADVLGSKLESTKIKERHLMSWFVRSFVVLFALVVALGKVGVSKDLMSTSFTIVLAAFAFGFALAFGIGFGLASKEDAKKALKHVKKKFN